MTKYGSASCLRCGARDVIVSQGRSHLACKPNCGDADLRLEVIKARVANEAKEQWRSIVHVDAPWLIEEIERLKQECR